jgi:Holliday junction DNA helicase RuvA
MIASLRGVVREVGDNELVLEVGGIGFRVAVTLSVLRKAPPIGGHLFLHTYLIVREDALQLFGFSNSEERRLFEMLLQVSGVGPRLALSAISNLSPETLQSAIANGQPDVLTCIPGIGRKTAEKIIFQLKDRIGAIARESIIPIEGDAEVISALTTLGYSLVESQAALQSIQANAPDEIEERIRLALQFLSQA